MPKVQMNMRVEQDLKLELDKIAVSQHRTVTNLIEWLIKRYLEQIAKRSAPAADEAMNGVVFAAAVEGTLGEWETSADDEAWNGL